MEFALANIWRDFKIASQTEQGTLDDNANEVILGPKLNEAVRYWANGYLRHLDLEWPENHATTERAKLLDLHWGRIEHDGALLRGLGAALTTFAGTLGANVTKLGERWQGESYNAFKAAMDKVQRTLSEYGDAATTTGDGLVNAMSQIREIYQTFADDSANKHLNFGEVSHPDQWHKMVGEEYSGQSMAEACPTWHSNWMLCTKCHDEQVSVYGGHWVTEKRWSITKNDPCEDNAGRVIIMYRNMVDECEKQIGLIKEKLGLYFGAVSTVVDGVSGLYEAALGNVYKLANEEVFSSLRVIGGQPTGGGAPTDTGTPTGDAGYPSGGDTGPVAVAEPMPAEPEPAPVEDTTAQTDTVAQEAPEPPADQPETVEIKDGDRTIGVTSPDGEGHVRITVEDGPGATKSYELDFDAASGLVAPTLGGVEPSPDAPEQIPARTDGKCVIQDGPLTITAERPLFSPDSIKLIVDDGSGNPTIYTLDFPEQDTTDPAEQAAAQSTSAAAPADTPATGMPAAPGQAQAIQDPAAQALAAQAQANQDPATQSPAAQDPAGQAPAVQEPVSQTSAAQEPAASQATQESAVQTPPAPVQEPAVNSSSEAVPAGATAPEPVAADQLTSPQVWHGDQTGSVSGVLVPDQSVGEAQLAKAPDAAEPQVGGMAGAAGVPITGGPPSGGSDSGRAGSGWSVHGDLFDSAEPVYSMHGVLGDDERVTE